LDNYKSFIALLPTLNAANAEVIALRLFQYQAVNNPVYAQYLHHLKIDIPAISKINDIPFMPISFFKNHEIKTGDWAVDKYFSSSGTTGSLTSTHYVADLNFYLAHAEACFTRFFGPLTEYHFLALMPSYLERGNSSLIAMMDFFIKRSQSEFSGFYLYEHDKLIADIKRLQKDSSRKIILWGVSFALLDLAEGHRPDLSGCMVFETGGMKGRRAEITRNQLHEQLKAGFNVDMIFSEYGMTELLSQAYTRGGDLFYPSPSMKIVIRDILDPFEKGLVERVGGINVIDFANIHSIAFIETEDSGKVYQDGLFEVLGRLDNTDVRGCNLLVG
jgi:hypothetical protein